MPSDFMFGDYQISPIGNVHGCPLAKSSCLFWVQNIKKRKNAAANQVPPNYYNSQSARRGLTRSLNYGKTGQPSELEC